MKTMKICKRCGKLQNLSEFYLFGENNTPVCNTCREDARRLKKSMEKYKYVKVNNPNAEVEDMAVEAQKAGMSYGKYVAMKERGSKCRS